MLDTLRPLVRRVPVLLVAATLASCGGAGTSPVASSGIAAPSPPAPSTAPPTTPAAPSPTPSPTPRPHPTPKPEPSPEPTPDPGPPEITRLEWTSYGNTTGGHETPWPGDHVQAACFVRASATGVVTVTLSARSSDGCTGPDHCWSRAEKLRLAAGRSGGIGWSWKTYGQPGFDFYEYQIVCKASSHGRSTSATISLPVP